MKTKIVGSTTIQACRFLLLNASPYIDPTRMIDREIARAKKAIEKYSVRLKNLQDKRELIEKDPSMFYVPSFRKQ
jgi:hypothetical protein